MPTMEEGKDYGRLLEIIEHFVCTATLPIAHEAVLRTAHRLRATSKDLDAWARSARGDVYALTEAPARMILPPQCDCFSAHRVVRTLLAALTADPLAADTTKSYRVTLYVHIPKAVPALVPEEFRHAADAAKDFIDGRFVTHQTLAALRARWQAASPHLRDLFAAHEEHVRITGAPRTVLSNDLCHRLRRQTAVKICAYLPREDTVRCIVHLALVYATLAAPLQPPYAPEGYMHQIRHMVAAR